MGSLQPLPPRPPYLISLLRAGLGRVSEAESSRGFFFGTSLIEPCQEKIVSGKGSRLFAGEQKKREGEGKGEQV